MNLYIFGLAALAVIFLGIVAFQSWIRRRSMNIASDWSKRTFPVWAALGPFEDGTDSAIAMANVLIVTMGTEFAKKSVGTLHEHRRAYDANTEEWESNRRWTLDRFGEMDYKEEINAAKKLRNEMENEDEEKVFLSAALENQLGGGSRKVEYLLTKNLHSQD